MRDLAVGATYGIDLASQPSRTAACLVEWGADGSGLVRHLRIGVADQELLERMTDERVQRVGIDAPFGWPSDFLDALAEYRVAGVWPDAPGEDTHQISMRLRDTDRAVHRETKLFPLSVSTDRIGIVAMRCARLLAAYWRLSTERPDRSGSGRVVEVYPAAALVQWGLSPRSDVTDPGSYKGKTPAVLARRERIMRSLAAAGQGWLEMSDASIRACIDSDDCLDALICALIARAAALGRVLPSSDPDTARIEGWIVLPRREPISALRHG